MKMIRDLAWFYKFVWVENPWAFRIVVFPLLVILMPLFMVVWFCLESE